MKNYHLGANEKNHVLNYFYNQVKNEFLNTTFKLKSMSNVFKLSQLDFLIHLISNDIDLKLNLIKKENFINFVPNCFRKKILFFFKFFNLNLILIETLKKDLDLINRNNFTLIRLKKIYLNQILNLLKNFGTETFNVTLGKLKTNSPNQTKFQLIFIQNEGLFIKNLNSKLILVSTFQKLNAIEIEKLTVNIKQNLNLAFSFTFDNELVLKSFVSLIDCVYKLCFRSNFDLCEQINRTNSSETCIHGPIGKEFAYFKLENLNSTENKFILRKSCKIFNKFKLDLLIENQNFKTFTFYKKEDDLFELKLNSNEMLIFKTIDELISKFTLKFNDKVIKLEKLLIADKFDNSALLLICKKELIFESCLKYGLKPKLFKNCEFNCLKSIYSRNGDFINQIVNLKSNLDKKYFIKFLRDKTKFISLYNQIDDWFCLSIEQNEFIKIFGLILEPFGLVLEYLEFQNLDDFLIHNKNNLDFDKLVEISFKLSKILVFLDKFKLPHGRIRCRQFLIVNLTNLKIKLKFPFNDFNAKEELAWLSPEFNLEEPNQSLTLKNDVWAFGTVLWEVFSYGKKPLNLYLVKLNYPEFCSIEIWNLIQNCHIIDVIKRIDAKTILHRLQSILLSSCQNIHLNFEFLNKYSTFKDNLNNNRLLNINKTLPKENLYQVLYDKAKYNKHFDCVNNKIYDNDLNLIFTKEDYFNQWLLIKPKISFDILLGQGFYGQVWQAKLKMGNVNKKVAIKKIKTLSLIEKKHFLNEIKLMIDLNHENIVQIIGFVNEPDILLIMEYLQLGCLSSYLKNCKKPNDLPLLKFAYDICNGMEYLEQKKVVHRDLAARNILVDLDNKVKISDFGLARALKSNENYYLLQSKTHLPINWYSLEALITFKFTSKSDVWSFGIVLWEIYSFGLEPNYNLEDFTKSKIENLILLLKSGIRLDCPDNCSSEIYNLMWDCWHEDASIRPNFSSILNILNNLLKSLS